MYDQSCIKSDVCDMAVCDGEQCSHRASTGGSANTSTNSASDASALLIRARDVILHGRDRSDNEPIVVSIDKFLTQRHA
jgi:hypothetical protein